MKRVRCHQMAKGEQHPYIIVDEAASSSYISVSFHYLSFLGNTAQLKALAGS